MQRDSSVTGPRLAAVGRFDTTLARCIKLHEEDKILAGGPMTGAVALVLIVTAESAQQLDDLITNLPVWPRMETVVTPLTTFDRRKPAVLSRLDELRAQERELEKTKERAIAADLAGGSAQFLRFIGIGFLIPGVVPGALPKAWAIPAEYGVDLRLADAN